MKNELTLLLAIIAFALCNCADLGRDNPYDPESKKYDPFIANGNNNLQNITGNPSSSSFRLSSSSRSSSSSSESVSSSSKFVRLSSSSVTIKPCVDSTVTIGDQIWQRCNLKVEPTSANGAATNSICYSYDENNCNIYGKLYDWATAMAFPVDCNENYCTDEIQYPHRGICPEDFHIPTRADWNKLLKYVDGDTSTEGDYYGSTTAGEYLKAVDGWNSYEEGQSSNGLDTYKFSALPGGRSSFFSYNQSYDFENAGYEGYWWSTDEISNGGIALIQKMDDNYIDTFKMAEKRGFFSVRCVHD